MVKLDTNIRQCINIFRDLKKTMNAMKEHLNREIETKRSKFWN